MLWGHIVTGIGAHETGGSCSKTRGAFSTSHSMQSALPAMSLNSAPGSRERISVAT